MLELFYNGPGTDTPSEPISYQELEKVGEPEICPTTKITASAMDAVLYENTGLHLEETNKVGLSSFEYLPEYDAYYLTHGDTNYRDQVVMRGGTHENDLVHLFIVSEDKSLFPFSVRQHLVKEGTAHLSNIVYHRSGSYIISNATFPGYFQKDSLAVMQSHAELDLTIFLKIAAALNIHVRYVGEENTSEATVLYNKVMAEKLPLNGIRCVIVPRKKQENGRPVSASFVRQAIKDGKMEDLKAMVPPSTLNYLLSAEAEPVLSKIRNAENVIHD